MPQIIFEISTEFLTTVVHNAIGSYAPCQAGASILTDINITKVVPLRGDETSSAAKKKLADLQQNAALDTEYSPVLPGPSSFPNKVASTFLLVGARFTWISEELLNEFGTSAKGLPLNLDSSPLLFRLTARPSADQQSVEVHLKLETLFDRDRASALEAQLKPLKEALKDLVLPLPLGGLGLGSTAGIAVGVATELWNASKAQPTGLRVAVNLYPAFDHLEWFSFFDKETKLLIDPAKGEDFGVAIRRSFFFEAVNRALLEHRDPTSEIGTGWASPNFTNGLLEVRVPVLETGLSITLGEAVLTLAPKVSKRKDPNGQQVTQFEARLCTKFDPSLEATLLSTALIDLVLPVASALTGCLFEPAIALAEALSGLLEGLVFTVAAKNALGGILAGLPLPPQCAPADAENCRNCTIQFDFFVDPIGHLTAAAARATADAFLLAGAVTPSPSFQNLAPIGAMSEPFIGAWDYPLVACKGSDGNPRKVIRFQNDGKLPLLVCEVSQHITDPSQPAILKFSRHIQKPGPTTVPVVDPTALLAPGDIYSITVTALFNHQALFDPSAPPPLFLRILTSGGAREADLNGGGDVAQLQSPAEEQQSQKAAQLLCDVLSWSKAHWVWNPLTYTDPLPFREADHVVERMDLMAPAPIGGRSLAAFSPRGELLAEAFSVAGQTRLTVEQERAPAKEHSLTQISFRLGGGAARSQPQSHASPAPRMFRRSLYREGPWFGIDAEIHAFSRFGSQLALLTEDELRIASVGTGRIGPWFRRTVRGACTLAEFEQHLVIATGRQLLVLDKNLRHHWGPAGAYRALAAFGSELWAVDERAIVLFLGQNGHLSERRRIIAEGVSQLLPTALGVCGIINGEAFILSQGALWPLCLRAEKLSTVAGMPALINPDGVITCDEDGRILARYRRLPRLSSAVEFSNLTVQVIPKRGQLNVFDYFETTSRVDRPVPRRVKRISRNKPSKKRAGSPSKTKRRS